MPRIFSISALVTTEQGLELAEAWVVAAVAADVSVVVLAVLVRAAATGGVETVADAVRTVVPDDTTEEPAAERLLRKSHPPIPRATRMITATRRALPEPLALTGAATCTTG
jgi:hypothetical protein